MGDIYRATVNQYAGVLPVEIVQNIQDIGAAHLSANISKADNQTRNDINAAVLSVVASTSGNTATLTYVRSAALSAASSLKYSLSNCLTVLTWFLFLVLVTLRRKSNV